MGVGLMVAFLAVFEGRVAIAAGIFFSSFLWMYLAAVVDVATVSTRPDPATTTAGPGVAGDATVASLVGDPPPGASAAAAGSLADGWILDGALAVPTVLGSAALVGLALLALGSYRAVRHRGAGVLHAS